MASPKALNRSATVGAMSEADDEADDLDSSANSTAKLRIPILMLFTVVLKLLVVLASEYLCFSGS